MDICYVPDTEPAESVLWMWGEREELRKVARFLT